MATNFPTSIDSFTNPSSGDTLDSPSHAAQHTNINDAMVAVQTKLGTGAGTIGEWTSFTPSWTNLTVGNGIQFFYYCVIGDIMFITGAWQLGSTSSIGTGPYFTIPGGYSITGDAVGASKHWDVTFGVFSGYCDTYAPLSIVQPGAHATGGSFATFAPLSATVPFTWAPGDVMYLSIFMRVS